MGLESHDGRSYYYRKVWRGGRATSVYAAAGEMAELADRLARLSRARAEEAREIERRSVLDDLELERLCDVYCKAVEAETASALLAAGFHRHDRGSWRRRRRADRGA